MTSGGVVPGGIWRRTRLRDRRDLRDGGVDVRRRLEEDLDDGDAGERLRLDVLDVVDGGRQRALVAGDDAVGHLGRGEAAVVPDDADDRDVDVREDVGRRPLQNDRGHEEDHDREDDEGVGTAKREADDPHGFAPSNLVREAGAARGDKAHGRGSGAEVGGGGGSGRREIPANS